MELAEYITDTQTYDWIASETVRRKWEIKRKGLADSEFLWETTSKRSHRKFWHPQVMDRIDESELPPFWPWSGELSVRTMDRCF